MPARSGRRQFGSAGHSGHWPKRGFLQPRRGHGKIRHLSPDEIKSVEQALRVSGRLDPAPAIEKGNSNG
jgi:hypothetical protein